MFTFAAFLLPPQSHSNSAQFPSPEDAAAPGAPAANTKLHCRCCGHQVSSMSDLTQFSSVISGLLPGKRQLD